MVMSLISGYPSIVKEMFVCVFIMAQNYTMVFTDGMGGYPSYTKTLMLSHIRCYIIDDSMYPIILNIGIS